MARFLVWSLLACTNFGTAMAADSFSALLHAVYTETSEQHHDTIRTAEDALAEASIGFSSQLQIRPSLRLRTDTDPYPRLRVDASAGLSPQPVAIARASLALERAITNAWQARIRAVEAELNRHLDYVNTLAQYEVAAHQVRTAEENLRQIRTSDDDDETLVALAEIEVRHAQRNEDAILEGILNFERTLIAPHVQLFGTPDVFAWRFQFDALPLTEHPRYLVLLAEANVATSQLHDEQFRPLRTAQARVTWEADQFDVQGTLQMNRGAPAVEVAAGYDSAGTQNRVTVELSGEIHFTNTTSAQIRTAEARLQEAQQELSLFVQDGVIAVDNARRVAERAEAVLDDALLTQYYAQQALANAIEREAVRKQGEYDRSITATHRAWKQYLRAMRDYLEVSGGTWLLR